MNYEKWQIGQYVAAPGYCCFWRDNITLEELKKGRPQLCKVVDITPSGIPMLHNLELGYIFNGRKSETPTEYKLVYKEWQTAYKNKLLK